MMKFDGLSDYRQNEDYESKQGIVLDFGDGVKITGLRAGGSNFKYLTTFQEAIAPYRRGRGVRKLTPEEDRRLLREVYVDSVIIGWEGVSSDGVPVPFTRDNVLTFLETFDEVFSEIVDKLSNSMLFLDQQKEEDSEDLKNS